MRNLLLFFSFITPTIVFTQDLPLTYYLPDITYDEKITTPEEYLGWQIGNWHISHDLLQGYLKTIAAQSDRVYVEQYARSHEGRPLLGMVFTSIENQRNIEQIKKERSEILEGKADKNRPVVIYQGYSIHGNESSGANAAILMAYYLAAGQSNEIKDMLNESVIIIDPCLNPDGLNRFASWVNTHKSKNLNSDANGREFQEAWPRGRTNHYWFDLNRDWLPLVHPESIGRLEMFHKWKPNILTDHHEMGSDRSFFFQPGIPTRTNPITPQKNQDLTAQIGKFHAAELDKIGSLYYSQESFDDFYYGKGSTYPDVNGCIGILFEQASSRGHVQQTENGELSFPFTIRNQVATSLSTQRAGYALRNELKEFQNGFYKGGAKSGEAYVIEEQKDKTRLNKFLELLLRHQINVYKKNESQYVVPLNQPQHLLIGTIFESNTEFRDSLFYDVSTWTMPLAYNLKASKNSSVSFNKSDRITEADLDNAILHGKSDYGYVFSWDDYYSPRLLYALLDNGVRARVASKPFGMNLKGQQLDFTYGAIIIPAQNQNLSSDEIYTLIQENIVDSHIQVYPIESGMGVAEVDLGSPSMNHLELPKIMMVIDGSVTSYDAGEVWHLLDQNYNMPVTMVSADNVTANVLKNYNTVVLVNGTNVNANVIKSWTEQGGVLITFKGATRWAINNGLAKANVKGNSQSTRKGSTKEYRNVGAERGAQFVGGAIFESHLDLSHPLSYGYYNKTLPLFKRGTLTVNHTNNPYAQPLVYKNKPLLSGYISSRNHKHMANSAAVFVSGAGRGRVISFVDNTNFRGFWYGTHKLFANAIFFGSTINGATIATSK